MDSNRKIFARDDKFGDNYLKGRAASARYLLRPHIWLPPSQGQRAWDRPRRWGWQRTYAQRLRSRFAHVIVSDVVAENVELTRARVSGADGFRFRTSKVGEADDVVAASVDMVFATNVMRFPDPQAAAMRAIPHPLRPGGTFASALFGPARFHDAKLQDL